MSKSVRVSEAFHEFVAAHNRDDETVEETLRRLVGGPQPSDIAGILTDDTAATMRDHTDEKTATGVESKTDLRERFE